MPAISGSNTVIAMRVATTWGTPVAATTGGRISGELSWSDGATTLSAREIGSGNAMRTSVTRGAIFPTVSLTMDVGYDNNFDRMLAVFMGTSAAPTEVTASQGDYRHTLTFNTTLNNRYVTLAFTSTDSTTIEFPTCAVQSVSITPSAIPGYLQATFELLANDIALTSATNTYAVVTASTLRTNSDQLCAVAFNDSFWVNTQAGVALSSSDKLNVTGWTLSLTRPQEIVPEITGSTGLGAPIQSDLFEGNLQVDMKELPSHTWMTAALNETTYKCKIAMDGAQIGTGTNREVAIYIPRMQLVNYPEYNVSGPQVNPVSMQFEITKAAANPTGMNSTYPYFEVKNTLATSLLA